MVKIYEIKLNVDLGGYKAGTVLKWKNIKSKYWRDRIKDAGYDNCVEVIFEPGDYKIDIPEKKSKRKKYKRKSKSGGLEDD